MTTSQDALKEFETQGKTDEPSQKKDMVSNPTIKLHNGEGEDSGLFVLGKFLMAKQIEKSTPQGKRKYMFVDVVLEKTNATATIKEGTKYRDVPVKPGDIVTLFAASRLFNAAVRLAPGTRLYAAYAGGAIEKGKLVHKHVIKTLPGSLTEKEQEYVSTQTKRREAAVDASKAKVEDESAAADAMSQLED
jgi:hypothetical protein